MIETNDPALRLAQTFGYLTPSECITLELLAASLGPGAKIANIGAGAGTSAMAMQLANPTATVWTIDISPSGPYGGLENERNAYRDFAGFPRDESLQILGDSHDVGRNWLRQHRFLLDMAFIDADHVDAGIRGDIHSWRPNVKPGGIMVFHDYTRYEWPDVKVVVDELMADCPTRYHVDTLMTIWLPVK